MRAAADRARDRTPRTRRAASGRIASKLVARLRAKTRSSGVEGLIHEYSLSSQEGVALMCLAEALLRIPDAATRDALIRDKLAPGDWRAHLGQSPSLFVNAATWGLVLTGKLVTTTSEQSLSAALTRLIAARRRADHPRRRRRRHAPAWASSSSPASTIEEAIAQRPRARGARLHLLLRHAGRGGDDRRGRGALSRRIRARRSTPSAGLASGAASIDGPGISIKLSALHPRYQRIKRARVMAELLPRVKALAALAKALRHRLQHRRRGGRPARTVARSAGGAGARPGAYRLERARLRHPGLRQALRAGRRLAGRSRAPLAAGG